MFNNVYRAKLAGKIITQFGKTDGDPHDQDSNLVDILANIMHYCNISNARDNRKYEFHEAIDKARAHYEAEVFE